jgi:hypothetical protein
MLTLILIADYGKRLFAIFNEQGLLFPEQPKLVKCYQQTNTCPTHFHTRNI